MSASRGFTIFIRFIACLLVAVGFAGKAATIFSAYDPQADAALLSGPPIAELVCSLASVQFALLAVGVRRWRGLVWACRVVIPATALATWFYFDRSTLTQSAVLAGFGILLLIIHQAAQRRALGFFVDAHGERQRVLGVNRGSYIHKRTSRGERVVQEHETRSRRRKWLFFATPLVVLIDLGLYEFYLLDSWVWMIVLAFPAMILTLSWLLMFGSELLYISGNQFIEGAKVLDRLVEKPGLEDVERQRVHGDAQFASADEARRLVNSGRRTS